MLKKYTYKEMNAKAFVLPSEYGGFPTTCMECGSRLENNKDFDYQKEWTASYTCTKCGAKFAYQPSDMGQSLSWISKYDAKEDVFPSADNGGFQGGA